MEAENRFPSDADPVGRNDPQHQGAGGRASSVDDDLLTRIPDRHIARPVLANIAATVVGNANAGGCGLRQCRANAGPKVKQKSRTRA